jgi:hypothetical protein
MLIYLYVDMQHTTIIDQDEDGDAFSPTKRNNKDKSFFLSLFFIHA